MSTNVCYFRDKIQSSESSSWVNIILSTKMRLLLIFIGLCVIRKSIQKLKFHEDNIKETQMNQILCVKTGFRKYFRDSNSNLLVFTKNSNDIVNSLPKIPIFVLSEWDFVRKTSFDEKGAVIIFLEGNSDQDLNGLKRLQGIVMVQPVLIVCITDPICSSEMYIIKIVEMVHSAELHYVAVDHRGIIDIYKGTNTVEGLCGAPMFLRVGHCSDKSLAEKVFQTFVNYHKCPIRIITWPCPPFSRHCDNADETDQDVCGIEGKVMQAFIKQVNATPVFLTVETPIDVRRNVAHRYADVGFGQLDTRPHEGISYSQEYLFLEGTVIAPHSMWTLKGSMANILLPLKFEVWLGIGVVIVLIFIFEILLPYFRKIYALELFRILIGSAVPRQPRELPIRIYFISLVFFGYLCSQSYLSNLTKTFVNPERPMIETLDALEESNLRVTGSSAARERFKLDYPRIYNEFETEDYSEYYAKLDKLLMGESKEVFYVETSQDYIANWKWGKAIENGISWYPVAMVTSNSSALLGLANKLIPSIVESGILYKYKTLFPLTQISGESSEPTSLEPSKVLQYEDLKSVFLVLISGLGLSFFVFLIEIITPLVKMKMGFKGRGKILPKRISRHGILLGQTSRARR